MIFTMNVNVDEVLRGYDLAGVNVRRALSKAVGRTAALMQARVRKNASTGYHERRKIKYRGHIPGTGPGPNVDTGNYKRSIQTVRGFENGFPSAIVGTNAPQARRLEYGFRGTDSAGRNYDQPPYPHWEPAVKALEGTFEQEVRKAIVEALKRNAGK